MSCLAERGACNFDVDKGDFVELVSYSLTTLVRSMGKGGGGGGKGRGKGGLYAYLPLVVRLCTVTNSRTLNAFIVRLKK